MMRADLSRRTFLRVGVGGGVALVIGFRLSGTAAAQGPQERKAPSPFDAWIRIDKEGGVTLTVAKSEMGQGVLTSLAMILGEELDVDWRSVHVEQAPTQPAVYDHGTGGSGSVRTSWLPLRQAGAAARAMLVQAAAAAWQVNANTCKTEKGTVVHGPRQKRLLYRDLVVAAARLPVPNLKTVSLKNPAEFTIVGESLPRTDIPSKVDGSALYGLDVRVPGMLYAVVARCPVFGGRPATVDPARALAVPGVRRVVEIPLVEQGAHSAGGVAVVADNTWAAMQGREALKIEWNLGPHAAESSQTLLKKCEELSQQAGKVVRNDGDALAALASAAHKLEAVYQLPFQAHATMEPMNCTVDIRADRAEAWVPSQGPQWAQDVIARIGQLKPEAVTVHTTLMGGGFGRRYQADFVVEAAQVSKAVGAPIHLVWTREDDIQHDFYRPAAYHRLSAALDDQGRPRAWMHRLVSTSINDFWRPDQARPEASEIGGAVNLPYAFPSVRVEFSPAPTGVPVAWWRSVEHSINGFVTESFLDEVAAAAKVDPLELRRRLLSEPRQIRLPPDNESLLDTGRLWAVVELAAARAGWAQPPPPGRGRGLACHFSFDTYVAEVAEVSVDKDGAVRVHRVVGAVDCGRAVNPDGVRAQMESAIVYGLSAALKSGITIAEGRVQQSNFYDFEVLRINEMPVVEVHIVPSREAPTGIGEPGLPPIAAAVGNAIFAATGKRIRRLPIQPADLA
jgi:isoquinoline 1-oxidoreductase beta subunit